VAVHGEVEQPLGGIVAGLRPDRGERVEVHAAGEGVLAGGHDDPLDRVIGQRLIDQRLDGGEGLPAQHVHGLCTSQVMMATPSASVHGEIGHFDGSSH
jgi:hypothetical protein